jgi:hypothetical protein
VEVFGGIILEPPAGGVRPEIVDIALRYGYGPGTGARFVSMPTHHTRNIALAERRSREYVEEAFSVPLSGPLPGALVEILDLISRHDVVLNTGHVSAPEALRLATEAKARGVDRVLVPCDQYSPAEVAEIARTGAYAEFSFFFHTHATMVALTHVDAEKHRAPAVPIERTAAAIRAASPSRTVLSGDLGVYLLPPPVEGFREFLLLVASQGFSEAELRLMSGENPAALFKVGSSRR